MGDKPVDTAITMVVGPCIDDTDFKTLEEAIAYDAAGMDVSLIQEKTDGTTAVVAITLTTGGTSDFTHKDGGYYEVEITAVQNAEEGIAYVRGVCTGVLPFESAHYSIVPTKIYDSLTKGTDSLEVDAIAISGDSTSADNLELDYDGTGYTKTNSVIGTCTTNTDMVGTAGANTVVPDAAGVAPTAAEIKTEVEQAGSSLAQILTDTSTTLPARFTGVEGATFLTGTDSLEAIRNRGDIAWITATGFATPNEYDTEFTDIKGTGFVKDTHSLPQCLTATGFSTHDAAAVWSVGTRALTDKVGFSLSTAGIDTIWDDLISGMTAVGSIGKLIGDNLNATISSRNATTPPTVVEIRTEMDTNSTDLNSILGDTNELQTNQGNWVTATTVALSAQGKLDVNTEVVDVMKTDVTTEMGQGAPPASPTFQEMWSYIYFKLRNKCETTSTEDAIYNNAGTVKLFKSAISDNGVTFSKEQYVSGV